jgi:hypothetical protein
VVITGMRLQGTPERCEFASLGLGGALFAKEQVRAMGTAALFFDANGFGVDQQLSGAAASRILLLGSGKATDTEYATYFGAGGVQVGGSFLSSEPAIGRYAHFEKSSSAAGLCA